MLKKMLSAGELVSFTGQIALVLDAGLPLCDALETMAAGMQDTENGQVYRALAERFSQSGDLAGAMREDPVWPAYVAEMTGIGERSGKLEQVMRGLSVYYEREDRIRTAVRGAVNYPLMLGLMLMAIVLIILRKVVPVFRKVLGTMGLGAGAKESVMIRAGAVIGWVVLAVVGTGLVALAVISVMMKTKSREGVLRFVRNCSKPLRALADKLSAARLATVLSMLFQGGFPLSEAVRMAASVLPDEDAKRKVSAMTEALERGEPFSEALAGTEMFDTTYLGMVRMGVTAGREAEMLEKVAGLYETQAEDAIGRILSVIEPTLVALLAVVIGMVLLSVMLPMAGVLMSTLG